MSKAQGIGVGTAEADAAALKVGGAGAVDRAACAACCCDQQDAVWGRLPGAVPPLRTWIPAVVATLVAVALTLVVFLLVRSPGPLDNPDPAEQRNGLVINGRVVPGDVGGVRFGGHAIVVLFERHTPAGPDFEAWKRSVVDHGVELVVRSGQAGDELARVIGMAKPVDGGRPVGYAVIDASRRVRYSTLDPAYAINAFEVIVISDAVA